MRICAKARVESCVRQISPRQVSVSTVRTDQFTPVLVVEITPPVSQEKLGKYAHAPGGGGGWQSGRGGGASP